MAKYNGKDLLIQRAYDASTAWLATTAYTVGQVRKNGGNVYRCITAGTSAASGGPTTTAADITDGTAHWSYVSVLSGNYGYSTIAGMRSTSVKLNNEQVDVTDKGDAPWRQLQECGVRSMELSASGVFRNDTVMSDIMNDVNTGAIQLFRITSGRGDQWQGSFLVASCERSGEYNKEEQYSLSLSSAGEIAYTPAA